jgi:hypothetical protein
MRIADAFGSSGFGQVDTAASIIDSGTRHPLVSIAAPDH